MSQTNQPSRIRTRELYGNFDRSTRRQQRLNEQIVRRSLNLPGDDETNVTVNHGIGIGGVAGIGAAILLSSILSAVLTFLTTNTPAPPAAAPVGNGEAAAVAPAAQEFRVIWEGEDGVEVKQTE